MSVGVLTIRWRGASWPHGRNGRLNWEESTGVDRVVRWLEGDARTARAPAVLEGLVMRECEDATLGVMVGELANFSTSSTSSNSETDRARPMGQTSPSTSSPTASSTYSSAFSSTSAKRSSWVDVDGGCEGMVANWAIGEAAAAARR